MNKTLITRFPAVPYSAAFVSFIVITGIEPYFPGGHGFWYVAKTAIVALVLATLVRGIDWGREVRLPLAFATGLCVLAVWILSEGFYPLLGESRAYNPLEQIGGAYAVAWIGIRLAGAAVVVPIAEELFWRGFLIRWIVKADFRSVHPGTFTWASFLVTTSLFALEHNRWLPGIAAGALYNLLLYRTGSLKSCIVAHATTNLGLGVYVLATGSWTFW